MPASRARPWSFGDGDSAVPDFFHDHSGSTLGGGFLKFARIIETAMIKKIGSKYVVLSETTGRKFGTYKTKAEASKRLQQIEFFKHVKKRKKSGDS